MRNSLCGFWFIVLPGCLMLPADSGRPVSPEAKHFIATAVELAPFDASKIHLIFCLPGRCNYFGGWQDCYACVDGSHKENLYRTMGECRAKCPVCDPTCHAQTSIHQSAMQGGAVHAPRNGTFH